MRYFVSLLIFLAIAAMEILYGGIYNYIFRIPAYMLLALALFSGAPTAARTRTGFSASCILTTTAFFSYVAWRCVESSAWQFLALSVAAFSIYLLFAAVINQPAYRGIIIIGILLISFLQALIGLYQYFRDPLFMPLPWLSEQLKMWMVERGIDRAHGTYFNPNQYGGMLVIAGIYAMAMAFWAKLAVWLRLILIYLMLACFAGAAVSLSRSSLLGLCAGTLLFLLISIVIVTKTATSHRRILAIFLMILTGTLAMGGGFFYQNSFQMQNRLHNFRDVRPDLWEAAIRQFETAPFVGTGPASYLRLSRIYINRLQTSISGDVRYAHNDYVQMLAELGIIGLALAILVAATHFFNGYRQIKRHIQNIIASEENPRNTSLAIYIGAFCALVIWGIYAAFDSIHNIPANTLLASATFGLLGSYNRHHRSREDYTGMIPMPHRMAHFAVALVMTACAIFLTLFCYQNTGSEYHALIAENALLKQDTVKAMDAAEAALEEHPDNPRFNYLSGEALMRAGIQEQSSEGKIFYYEAAQEAFLKAVTLQPDEYYYWLRLANAYDLTSEFETAKKCYLAAIVYNPSFGLTYEEYGKHYLLMGDLVQAKRYARLGAGLPGSGYRDWLPKSINKLIEEQKKQAQVPQ